MSGRGDDPDYPVDEAPYTATAPLGGSPRGRSLASKDARRSAAVRSQLADTSAARGAFEARWSQRRLQTIDASLYARLQEQIDIFDRALFHGEADEIERQGQATCRGWSAAVKAMEAVGERDDAYLLGSDHDMGVCVAIGECPHGPERVAAAHGDHVVCLTPDEVATLYAASRAFEAVDAIKRRMPGAEVVAYRSGAGEIATTPTQAAE